MKSKASTSEQPSTAAEAIPFDDGALFEQLDLGRDFYLGLARAAAEHRSILP